MNAIRQIRINDSAQIKLRVSEFIGKKINIVLENKMAMHGELKQVEADGIVLINMRLKKMRFNFKEIAEVYFDVIV